MNTTPPGRRATGALWRRARSCASSSSGSHAQNFTPKQMGQVIKNSLPDIAHRTRSIGAKESNWYTNAQTGYQFVEAVVRLYAYFSSINLCLHYGCF
ncbi:hypothetical protein PISMIDRAFT_675249 [Pisolithus microcarpus 441]|uniref:Uncharacterized protein n=1 Tax=Pisolithus microcarpus 441 TaxID=765257 RepID=A0A0C9ZCH4_9AGAM|nr:hypothetical protein PISMIDRAFT_675249 [Pisolithus microcarpus 441]